MAREIKTEVELAHHFIQQVHAQWACDMQIYCEVKVPGVGIADLVLVNPVDDWTTIVECKLGMSFELLAQCSRWVNFANRVMAVVPHKKNSDARLMAHQTFKDHSVGVTEVSPGRMGTPVQCQPCISVDPLPIMGFLKEAQLYGTEGMAAPGSRGGNVPTPRTIFLAGVIAYVREYGFTKLAHLVRQVPIPKDMTHSKAMGHIKAAKLPEDLQLIDQGAVYYLDRVEVQQE